MRSPFRISGLLNLGMTVGKNQDACRDGRGGAEQACDAEMENADGDEGESPDDG
jgi:hypothetical protein